MKVTKSIPLVLALLLIVSCATQFPDTTNNIATFTPQPQTSLPTVRPSETATSTRIPTRTSTLISTITWTPLPTLSMRERGARIKELLETNGGCELPCWWGITPYKTAWSEALHFLTPIIVKKGQGGSSIYYEDGYKHFTTNFDVYYEIPGLPEQGRLLFGIQDDMIISINAFPPGTQNKYQIHQVLALLGTPKQIYISAQSSKPWSELFTVFVLDYSDIGVWVFYRFVPSLIGESFFACSDSTGARLFLFDPTKENKRGVTIVEAAELFGGVPAKKMEDAANMTTEKFYAAFIDPNSGICLETPTNLWP